VCWGFDRDFVNWKVRKECDLKTAIKECTWR